MHTYADSFYWKYVFPYIRGVFGHFEFSSANLGKYVQNNTHRISIIFPPAHYCSFRARLVIIIPAGCSISRARYYGVILYSENKSRVFSRARRDYDSCNKPISIGRHTMAAPRRRIATLYIREKERGALPRFLPLFFFISIRTRIKLFDEFANGAGRNNYCSLYPCLLPDPRTRRRPPAADSLARNN